MESVRARLGRTPVDARPKQRGDAHTHPPVRLPLQRGAVAPLRALAPQHMLAVQRTAGNAAATRLIQRQPPTKEEKEAKKAETKDAAEQAAQQAIDAAKEAAPEQAADKVKDAVGDKLTDPALARVRKKGDPDKVADAEAAAEQLKDMAGTAAESITKSVLSGDKVGPSLAAALEKKLKPKPMGTLDLPKLELDSCKLGVGTPKPTGPLNLLTDPSKVGASWKVLDGKCTFSSGETLNFSTTFSTKGFLDKNYSLRPPTSFTAEAGIEFKGRGFSVGATYKLNKDPEAVGHTGGLKATIFF